MNDLFGEEKPLFDSKPIPQIQDQPSLDSVYYNKYEFDYLLILNNHGEDGLMDTYISETNIEGDKPRADISDWFNFGLDEEKWIKLLNKNILMNYEKQLLAQIERNYQPQILRPPNMPMFPYPGFGMIRPYTDEIKKQQ